MSESFYKYLIDDILAKFFAKNPAKEGEHYCLVIESEENRIGIINGFKNSTHSRELTVEGIYEGRIENPELDRYETIQFDADDEGASVPFIIADIDTGGEYLPTIRNAVNKGKNMINTQPSLYSQITLQLIPYQQLVSICRIKDSPSMPMR